MQLPISPWLWQFHWEPECCYNSSVKSSNIEVREICIFSDTVVEQSLKKGPISNQSNYNGCEIENLGRGNYKFLSTENSAAAIFFIVFFQWINLGRWILLSLKIWTFLILTWLCSQIFVVHKSSNRNKLLQVKTYCQKWEGFWLLRGLKPSGAKRYFVCFKIALSWACKGIPFLNFPSMICRFLLSK